MEACINGDTLVGACPTLPPKPRVTQDHSSPSPSVTQALDRLRSGDRSAFEELVPLVYDELRSLARRQMRDQPPGHTLQATELVNAAFERLLRQDKPNWHNKPHFVSAAVVAMRCVLVDHARTKGRARRGGSHVRVPLDDLVDEIEARTTNLLALDDSLQRMEEIDARMVRVVEHTLFGGLTVSETAKAMGLSKRTVERELSSARAWLLRERM